MSTETEAFDPAPHRPTGRGLKSVALIAVSLLIVLLMAGAIPRFLRHNALDREVETAATVRPQVLVTHAQRPTASAPVALPATVQPLQESAIYARASGYVRKWYVDLGAEVKQGQVLAELDLPDVDQELHQARAVAKQSEAAVVQAKRQLDFAGVTNKRYAALAPEGVVSQQQSEQYASEYDVRVANVDAAEAARGSSAANVRRMEELRHFGTLTAPFDGVVTLRTAEIGQLVTPGTGQGQALFRVAQDDVVRLFVNVPQLYAAGVKPGAQARVTVRETPGRIFNGTISRTSRALDPASRSLRVEVDVKNPDRALVPGMFAKVALDIDRQDSPLLVPATSTLINANGIQAAVVKDGVLRWQKVEISADLGDRLAISSGLSDGDSVVVNPSERLREGMQVQSVVAP